QHFAAEGVDREGDAVEPGVEGRDDFRRRIALGKGSEAAQIGKQQRRLDGLADATPQRARQHPRRAALAEIGFQNRRQRGARRQRSERGRREARGLAEAVRLVAGEWPRSDPAERRAVRPGPPGWLAAPAAASPAGANPNASITSPLSARHSHVRWAMSGCGAASVRAPPASFTPSSIRWAPSFDSNRSAPRVSAAASTRKASVELSCMDRSWA